MLGSTLCAAVALGSFLSPAFASPLLTTDPSSFVHFETHRAPSSFRRIGDAPRSHTITLRISLRQPRIKELEHHLYAVSDPTHERYGAHLSADEVAALTAPHATSVDAVGAWLESHGLQGDWTRSQDSVVVPAIAITKAEEMLDTKYGVFRHDDGDHLVRTESYSLPHHLHQHIQLVQPTNMFGRLTPQKSGIAKVDVLDKTATETTFQSIKKLTTSLFEDLEHLLGADKADDEDCDDDSDDDDEVCDDAPTGQPPAASNRTVPQACTNPREVTSACLRQLYNTIDYTPQATDKNKLGLTGYLAEYAQFDDLAMFLKSERPDQADYKFTVVGVNGGSNPQGYNSSQVSAHSGIEANLDVQTAAGFTAPTTNIFYSTPGSPPFTPDGSTPTNTNEPYGDFLDFILQQSDDDLPKVISTSYGDSEQTVPQSYAERVCTGFSQLGARGVSVLFSSGDSGVGADGTCTSNDGSNKQGFRPAFPASCPFVSSVGATENFSPEQAVSASGPGGFASGAGFSNYFDMPDYQKQDVQAYVNNLNGKYDGLYNASGRAYPDVSAQGAAYLIAWNHKFTHVGGTSAASPTFSSVVALLNDYRLSQGKPVLGFLNPWLYQTGRQGLNDITQGSSFGCGGDGFPATQGWDAVTGLGTPDFKKLQSLLDNQDSKPQLDISAGLKAKVGGVRKRVVGVKGGLKKVIR